MNKSLSLSVTSTVKWKVYISCSLGLPQPRCLLVLFALTISASWRWKADPCFGPMPTALAAGQLFLHLHGRCPQALPTEIQALSSLPWLRPKGLWTVESPALPLSSEGLPQETMVTTPSFCLHVHPCTPLSFFLTLIHGLALSSLILSLLLLSPFLLHTLSPGPHQLTCFSSKETELLRPPSLQSSCRFLPLVPWKLLNLCLPQFPHL